MATPTVLVQYRLDLDTFGRIERLSERAGVTTTSFCKQAAVAAAYSGGGSVVEQPVRRETPPAASKPPVSEPIRTPEEAQRAVSDRKVEVQPYTRAMQTGRREKS